MVKEKKIKKSRPPRVWIAKDGRPYVLVNKKRVYLKNPNRMSKRKLVNIVIKNFKKQSRNGNRKIQPAPILEASSSSSSSSSINSLAQNLNYASFLNNTFLNKKEELETR